MPLANIAELDVRAYDFRVVIANPGGQVATVTVTRFGELMRLGGRYNGQQIVPKTVVDDIRRGGDRALFAPAGYKTLPGWSYRNMWWISHNDHGAFTARGRAKGVPAALVRKAARLYATAGNGAIYALLALSIDLIWGYCGILSLGHGAFFALGAYVSAISILDLGVPYLLTLPLAALACGIAGFLIGIPALRLRGGRAAAERAVRRPWA